MPAVLCKDCVCIIDCKVAAESTKKWLQGLKMAGSKIKRALKSRLKPHKLLQI